MDEDKTKTINVTFNYSAITDNHIIVSNLVYFAINDEVYISNDSTATITCELTNLYTPFLDIQIPSDEDWNGYYYNSNIKIYNYLENFFKQNYTKTQDDGYYKLSTLMMIRLK
ncbi:MAG: hypothetical protein ACLRWM_02915 [Streptococcus sp.]